MNRQEAIDVTIDPPLGSFKYPSGMLCPPASLAILLVLAEQ